MEIKVSISAIISIHEGEVNVNEILYETFKFGDLLKKEMAKKIIEHYQESMINKMCKDEEGLEVEHIEKGTENKICKERKYTRHGYRKEKREIKTEFGEIEFCVMNVKCKGCGKIFAEITKILKIGDRGRKTESLTMKNS